MNRVLFVFLFSFVMVNVSSYEGKLSTNPQTVDPINQAVEENKDDVIGSADSLDSSTGPSNGPILIHESQAMDPIPKPTLIWIPFFLRFLFRY